MLPAGSSAKEAALNEINASRTSSRWRLQGRMVFSGKYVGTSFIECTAMSIWLFISASSISLVNKPFPPMSASGWLSILSPVVFIITIWIAPSWASSGCKAMSLFRVSWAWASARGLSYIYENINNQKREEITKWHSNMNLKGNKKYATH